MSPSRLVPALFAVFLVVYIAISVIAGEASFVLATVLVIVLVLAAIGAVIAAQRNVAKRHGGNSRSAADDTSEPIPAAPLIADDDTPLGDTPDAHDEISPHDLPIDHPGRPEAERRAAGVGTTRGDIKPSEEKQPVAGG